MLRSTHSSRSMRTCSLCHPLPGLTVFLVRRVLEDFECATESCWVADEKVSQTMSRTISASSSDTEHPRPERVTRLEDPPVWARTETRMGRGEESAHRAPR